MATLALDSAQGSLLEPVAEERASAPGPTLDEVVARAWSALAVSRAPACLLCGGEVEPRYGSGPHPVGGTCHQCGTQLV